MTERGSHFADPDTAETIKIGVRIRTQRQRLGMTLKDVAEKSSLSPGFLSLVERDLSYPTTATLVRIAQAINTPVAVLTSPPQGAFGISKSSQRSAVLAGAGGVVFSRLSTSFPGSLLNAVEMTLPPGYATELTSHSGEEWVFVLSGVLTQTWDKGMAALSPGDCAHFQSIVPHSWANMTDEPVRLLWVGDVAVFPTLD